MNKPYVIGVTGGIGSGKTMATDYLADQGCCIIDADVESRALTAPDGAALPAIRERFGDGVFNEDGTLNRHALGSMVFEDREKRLMLEGIMHPMIQRSVLRKIRKAAEDGLPFIFLSVPLLYETGMDALCDETWCLSVSEEEQIKRVMARDNMTAAEAEKRIASQMTLTEREKHASRVIRTDRPIENTRAELNSLLKDLRRRFEK